LSIEKHQTEVVWSLGNRPPNDWHTIFCPSSAPLKKFPEPNSPQPQPHSTTTAIQNVFPRRRRTRSRRLRRWLQLQRRCATIPISPQRAVDTANSKNRSRRLPAKRSPSANPRNGQLHARLRRRDRVREHQHQNPAFQRSDIPREQGTSSSCAKG
jgi:hypothetical protein